MKHKELSYGTRNIPGYNAPKAPEKKKQKGVPCNQPFHQPAKRKEK